MTAGMIAFPNGTGREIHSSKESSAADTFPLSSTNTKLSWLTTDAGSTNSPMAMSGFPISITAIGGLTIMEDGTGILLLAGIGFPTSLGDGLFTTTADGTGGWAWVGTGFLIEFGVLLGFIGTGVTIISAGVL